MQNLARFYTTSDFDRCYLRKKTRYPKSESYLTENDISRVRRKKSGELWSTIPVFHLDSQGLGGNRDVQG